MIGHRSSFTVAIVLLCLFMILPLQSVLSDFEIIGFVEQVRFNVAQTSSACVGSSVFELCLHILLAWDISSPACLSGIFTVCVSNNIEKFDKRRNQLASLIPC